MRGDPAQPPGSEVAMSFLFSISPAPTDAFPASMMDRPIVYLVIAAICLVIVIRFLKRAMSPIGALFQAVTAAAVVAVAAVLALAMLIVAAVLTAR
jgi:hypothetical protein